MYVYRTYNYNIHTSIFFKLALTPGVGVQNQNLTTAFTYRWPGHGKGSLHSLDSDTPCMWYHAVKMRGIALRTSCEGCAAGSMG